jgi:hypothetical protein
MKEPRLRLTIRTTAIPVIVEHTANIHDVAAVTIVAETSKMLLVSEKTTHKEDN